MKNTLYAILLIISVSCSNKTGIEDQNPTQPNSNEVYFVRYETASMFSQYSEPYKGYVTTEKGIENVPELKVAYKRTYGPVEKGFKAEIVLSNKSIEVEIWACKTGEEFTIRARGYGSATYTIF